MDTERNERLDELLDETHPPVTVAGIEFSASRILYELDPIAYRCAAADMEDDD